MKKLALAFVAVTFVAVSAQTMQMIDPVRMKSVPMTLLAAPQVQGELKFSGKQKSELKKINDDLVKVSQQGNPNDMAMLGKMKAAMEEANKKAFDLLEESQRPRYHEIRYQVLGMRALNEPEVAEALALSEEQKAGAKAFEKAEFDGYMSAIRSGPRSIESFLKKTGDREKEFAKNLSPSQTAKLETLLGVPFKDLSKVRGF